MLLQTQEAGWQGAACALTFSSLGAPTGAGAGALFLVHSKCPSMLLSKGGWGPVRTAIGRPGYPAGAGPYRRRGSKALVTSPCSFNSCLLAPVGLGWISWKEPRSENAWIPATPLPCLGEGRQMSWTLAPYSAQMDVSHMACLTCACDNPLCGIKEGTLSAQHWWGWSVGAQQHLTV